MKECRGLRPSLRGVRAALASSLLALGVARAQPAADPPATEPLPAEPAPSESVAPESVLPAPPEAACACNECPFMRLNTLEKLYVCLRDMAPELQMPEQLREAARKPIDRMLALS